MQCISFCHGIGTISAIFPSGFRPFIESNVSIILHVNDAAPRLVDARVMVVARDISPECLFVLSVRMYFESRWSGGPPKRLLISSFSCLR